MRIAGRLAPGSFVSPRDRSRQTSDVAWNASGLTLDHRDADRGIRGEILGSGKMTILPETAPPPGNHMRSSYWPRFDSRRPYGAGSLFLCRFPRSAPSPSATLRVRVLLGYFPFVPAGRRAEFRRAAPNLAELPQITPVLSTKNVYAISLIPTSGDACGSLR